MDDNEYTSYKRFTNEVAFAVIATGKTDGSLAKEYDKDGNLVPVKIKIIKNCEEVELSINEIIPSLKNLEGKELLFLSYNSLSNELYDKKKWCNSL